MHRIGIVLAALAIMVFGGEAALAISHGVLVVGWNAWRQPLFAVMQCIVAVVAAPILLRYAMLHWNDTAPPRGPND